MSRRISRRRFLSGAMASGAGLLLAACGSRGGTGSPTPTEPADLPLPAGMLSPTAGPPLPSGLATYAGLVAPGESGRLRLQSPKSERELEPVPGFGYYNALGSYVGNELPPMGVSVAVWTAEGRAVAAQRLPPLAATSEIPAGLDQPAASGEAVALGPLTMITRAGWGAAPRQFFPGGESGPYDALTNPGGWLDYPPPLADHLTTLVVHHSALEFEQGPQTIQRLHMLGRGFADVGYHFLIDGLGQLYEGRPITARGAHVAGANTGAVGVCLLGNFEETGPLQAQLDALVTLGGYLRDTYTLTHLAGHRDFQPDDTVCPGVRLVGLLPGLADAMGLRVGIPS